MLRFLQYCISHCVHAAMTRLEEVNGEASMRSSVRWLGYLSGVNLLLGLCLGLYARWEDTAVSAFLVAFILALLALAAACVLYYFFAMERLSLALLHLLLGFLLGLLGLLNPREPDANVKERAANYLLLAAVTLRTLWALLERLLGSVRYRPAFLTSAERQELVGFSAAGTALLVGESVGVAALLVALAAVMVALRTKALLAPVSLLCFAGVTGGRFFKSLSVATNPFALGCFFGQLLCDPLLDFCFSGLSVTERWRSFLVSAAWRRRMSLLPLLAVEAAFVALACRGFARPERWYVAIPGFAACVIFWAICHVVFIITVWGFHGKLSECQRLSWTQGPDDSSLEKIMASKGMRHFCLVSVRLATFALVSTVAVAAVSWQEPSGIFMSTVLLVLTLECLFHGLFHELGKSLGGTCVGYAVVIPTNFCSPDGQPLLLPPDEVSRLNERSTGMLRAVQRFFACHLIESFGCDYSTSGVTLDALQAKVKAFLDLRTADGPRHDTYVIFYSGHSHRSGEWALAGGDALGLDQLLDWWREKNGAFRSRLIVVLDCDNSLAWVKGVRRVEGAYVAVQGAAPARAPHPPQLGDFTELWVDYNCSPGGGARWAERALSPDYGVSRHWSDYSLHLPSGGDDDADHWRAHFPRLSYPVVRLALWCGGLNLLWLCSSCLRYLRRIKLNWFPPPVLDTEQGFKLVRS